MKKTVVSKTSTTDHGTARSNVCQTVDTISSSKFGAYGILYESYSLIRESTSRDIRKRHILDGRQREVTTDIFGDLHHRERGCFCRSHSPLKHMVSVPKISMFVAAHPRSDASNNTVPAEHYRDLATAIVQCICSEYEKR